MNKIYLITLLLLSSLNIHGQDYGSPLDIPILLSANCGELRGNHFHAGIDIKTQGVIGKKVYSIEDGFVSRIFVSPGGYGLAIYVDHPNGQTSVYGHLSRFNDKIDKYVKEQQYKQESFRVDLKLKPNQFKVKKGDLIAYSGNTGGSGGPHVHLEIRDTKSEELLDPLKYFKKYISDNVSPEVRGIAAYPVPGLGVVNYTYLPLRQTVSKNKAGSYQNPPTPIEAWGTIGLGIKAYDRMSGTSNIYGVKSITMKVNGKQIFSSDISRFSFDQTRMINTFTDFSDWKLNKSFYMYSFVEPGNQLPFYKVQDQGYITVNEERPYNIEYTLTDAYGNSTDYSFTVQGKKQKIPRPSGCSLVMAWDRDNKYVSENFTLTVNKGNLYNDVCFVLAQESSDEYFSDIFTINNSPVPIDKSAEVKIKLKRDNLNNKKQYGLVQLNGTKKSWLGGQYNNGFLTTNIRELGFKATIMADTQAPTIRPVENKKNSKKNSQISQSPDEIQLRITDNLSGVASVRGTVDGKFVLFENDVKSPVYTYKIDADRIAKGSHTLEVIAIDDAGNKAVYTTDFTY